MDFFQNLPAPVLRIKTLIWVHSLIGAALKVGFFAVLASGMDPWLAAGIVACSLVWAAALLPLEKWASNIPPKDLVNPAGLPGRLLAVCAVVQLGGMAFGRTAYDGLLAIAYTVALVTLLARAIISPALGVPIHRKTWTTCMFLMGVGLGRHLFGYLLRGL